jgi:hypothetical protein
MASGAGALLIAFLEALDAAGGVHELLLAREKRVAFAADLEPQLLFRRAGRKRLTARAMHEDFLVFGMQILLHGDDPSQIKTIIIPKKPSFLNNPFFPPDIPPERLDLE